MGGEKIEGCAEIFGDCRLGFVEADLGPNERQREDGDEGADRIGECSKLNEGFIISTAVL